MFMKEIEKDRPELLDLMIFTSTERISLLTVIILSAVIKLHPSKWRQ